MRGVLACALALLWPAIGHACAVCGAVDDRSRTAFLITTIVMSLLPLALIGGGLLWLRRAARRRAESERAAAVSSRARDPERRRPLALER